MNTALWIAQVLLAVTFQLFGAAKLTMSRD
jgi:hypothetical protein